MGQIPDKYSRFCATWRIRVKDRVVHPYAGEFWPECLKVEGMSRDQLLELQGRRTAEFLADVVENVPFYRRWAQGAGYEKGRGLKLADFPIVTKDTFRAEPGAFASQRFKASELHTAKTSGSSGEPFAFQTHRRSADYGYCCLWRGLARHGLRPGQRRVYIWGSSFRFNADARTVRRMERRNRVRDWMNQTLMIDAYGLGEQNVGEAIERIEAFGPVYMHGYVSALYMIARRLAGEGRKLGGAGLTAVVTESEKLYDFQRETMEQAFGCRVLENYGSVELGPVAQPDPEGRMRINEDMHVVERAADGAAVVTNLMSQAYPFIRYRLGDLIECDMEPTGDLPYAVLTKVVGRTVDLLVRADGGHVHGMVMEHIIRPHLRYVRKYQVRQERVDRFLVRLELSEPLPAEAKRRITEDLRGVMGATVAVEIEAVNRIEPAPSGKFRWVISDVSALAQQAIGAEDAAVKSAGGKGGSHG